MHTTSVSGNVSVNLHNVSVAQAINSIAEAGGYVVEQPRAGEFVVLECNQAGLDSANSGTELRTYKVQYSNAKFVGEI